MSENLPNRFYHPKKLKRFPDLVNVETSRLVVVELDVDIEKYGVMKKKKRSGRQESHSDEPTRDRNV